MAKPSATDGLVIGHMQLRRAIGYLGLSLPVTLVLGAWLIKGSALQPTISDYYYTVTGDVFVGTICAIGIFLLSYRGYERKDDWAGNAACVFAVLLALFPTSPAGEVTTVQKIVSGVHYSSAAMFFGMLGYFSLRLFTKFDETKGRSQEKKKRDKVYTVCGWTIFGAIALIGVHALLPDSITNGFAWLRPVFWLETTAVLAFSFSWSVKGEAILGDKTA